MSSTSSSFLQERPCSRAVLASSCEELESVLEDDVNIAVLRRTLSKHAQQAYRRLAAHPLELKATLDRNDLAVLRDGATMQRAEPGSVVLLKGHSWPGNEGRGAIHRSPPIEKVGERRLLLKLDTPRCGC